MCDRNNFFYTYVKFEKKNNNIASFMPIIDGTFNENYHGRFVYLYIFINAHPQISIHFNY